MEKVNTINRHTLFQYFLGLMSEEEKEHIHQWIEQDEENRKLFIKERKLFDVLILSDKQEEQKQGKSYIQPYIFSCLKIAAAVLLIIGSCYLYGNYRIDKLSQKYQYICVPAGNRTNIILPDGTNVWLNANSSLRYPTVFSRGKREIELNGEAYFEVKKDDKPFIVKTDKYNIEVLGTIFSVEAYANSRQFKTSLYEGKVKLYNASHPNAVYLSPGQSAEQIGDLLTVKATKDVNNYRWKDGLIYIENKSFGEIMELFEKFYNVRIVINNKDVNELGYHGKLRIADGIDHALKVLQNDFPFKYKREEESNVIYIN